MLEAGRRPLAGDAIREANTGEISGLKHENKGLKQGVAQRYMRNGWRKNVGLVLPVTALHGYLRYIISSL